MHTFLETTITGLHCQSKARMDFLLVRNSNFGPILDRFGDLTDSFYVLLTPPIFQPKFGSVSVAPDRPCWGHQAHGPYAIWP